jgi:hypothetical protein
MLPKAQRQGYDVSYYREKAMAIAEVEAGICGFKARVEATAEGRNVRLDIGSDCPRVQKLAEGLVQVSALSLIGPRSQPNAVNEAAAEARLHAACVVPTAIVKAVEVAAGLALPRDVHIRLSV